MSFYATISKAIRDAAKEASKNVGKAPPKGRYRTQSPAPSGKATTAATSKEEIAKIKATNKRNKDMYGIGDDTPKYKQRAKRTAQVGVTAGTAAVAMSALPSKAELEKEIKKELGDNKSPTAAQAKAAGRKALKNASGSDLNSKQISSIMSNVGPISVKSAKAAEDYDNKRKAIQKRRAESKAKSSTSNTQTKRMTEYMGKAYDKDIMDRMTKKEDKPAAPAKAKSKRKLSAFEKAFAAARAKGEKTFRFKKKDGTWGTYHTRRQDEDLAAEKFNKGGYKSKTKKAAGGMLNAKKPRTGTMDYRKGGLFK